MNRQETGKGREGERGGEGERGEEGKMGSDVRVKVRGRGRG